MANQEPNETSPLLGKPPATAAPPDDPAEEETTNGVSKPGHDEESQEAEDREGQYEGMPDVKAKLKYIVPAVGIGVCINAAIVSTSN